MLHTIIVVQLIETYNLWGDDLIMGMIICKICDSVMEYYDGEKVSKLYGTCQSCDIKAIKK